MTTITRIARTFSARAAAVAVLGLFGSVTSAAAETLLMPNRDALAGTPVVIWGVTTRPNGTALSIDFGDPLIPVFNGAVADRSFINFVQTYTTPGVKTVTLTVTGEAPATVDIQVFAPSGPLAAEITRNVRINSAIQDGLRYLWVSQSNRTTFDATSVTQWGRPSFTALVVLAFENHGYRLPNNNTVPTGLYEKYVVRRGLNYLLSTFTALTLSPQPAGNPCVGPGPAAEFMGGGTCIGFYSNGGGETLGLAGYANALMILPFAGSGALDRTNTEVAGVTSARSFRDITQRLVDAMAFGQNDGGVGRGGWNYGFNTGTLDGSTAGWNVLAILDAQAAGIPLPSFLIPEFGLGINSSFNADGSFDYNADNNPTPVATVTQNHPTHRNLARGGIGAQAHFLMGGNSGDARGVTITDFINSRWSGIAQANDYLATCGGNNQNKNCGYAMFNVFKGLKLLGIQTLPAVTRAAGPGSIPANDWYADYQDWLVNNQFAPTTATGGNWNMAFSCCSGTAVPASTALGELILSSVALVLPDADKFASVGLSPATATAAEGGTHTVTATAESHGGAPVPGATVNFTIISGPNAGLTGTDVTDANGEATFTYTDQGPIPSFGTDRIRANIGTLNSNIVEMIWTPFNRAPVANPNSYTVDEDGVLSGNVITDAPPDTDEDGDTLTAAVVTGPSNGVLVFNNDGSFTYTPAPNFCGGDSFTYDLDDGEESSDEAAVSITITCVNDAPVAGDDTNSTTEDTPVGGSVGGDDTDVEGDPLTFGNASDPANGSVTLDPDGSYTYTPDANFCGTDSFTYEVSDGQLTGNTATVTVTVECVNDPPVADDSSQTTAEDTPFSSAVTSSDADGGPPTFAVSSGPTNGTVVMNPDGTYTYTPNANYFGPDSFTFTVSDGNGGTDTGMVSFTVTPVNDPPVCTAAAPTIALLWPANHQLVNIDVLGVVDPVEGSGITINVTGIFQDEPTNTQGDGNTPIDGFGVGTSTAQVRAERSGAKQVPGDGRMYYINFTGTDAQGGTCTGTVQVGVPRDQGQGSTVTGGGPLYNSTGS